MRICIIVIKFLFTIYPSFYCIHFTRHYTKRLKNNYQDYDLDKDFFVLLLKRLRFRWTFSMRSHRMSGDIYNSDIQIIGNFDHTCFTSCTHPSWRTSKTRSILYVADIVFAIRWTLFLAANPIESGCFTAWNKQSYSGNSLLRSWFYPLFATFYFHHKRNIAVRWLMLAYFVFDALTRFTHINKARTLMYSETSFTNIIHI